MSSDASGTNEEECGYTVKQKGLCLVQGLVDKDHQEWVDGSGADIADNAAW